VPELPEVETVRRQLEPLLVGRRITAGWGHPSAKFASAPLAVGPAVEAVGRRGKYLLTGLDDGRELIVHLGMTGQLRFRNGAAPDPYVRAFWELDDGSGVTFRTPITSGGIPSSVRPGRGRSRALPALVR
jgi:formamidopyrimidine-DNA glycosylase